MTWTSSQKMGFFEPELHAENGSGHEHGSGSGSGNTITGTNNDDSEDKSTSTDAWTFNGFSGNDNFKGGSGNDIFFGGLGADDLTGNGGSDTYFFTDFLEGADTIRTFSAADTLKFAHNFTNTNYSRNVTFTSDSGSNGSVHNIGATSGNLPIVFNFTANNSNHTSSAGVSNFLSNFRVTTDGSTSISTVEDALLVTGNGGATSIWGWQNSAGNGTVEQTELVRLATLNSYDNDSMTAANVAFGAL